MNASILFMLLFLAATASSYLMYHYPSKLRSIRKRQAELAEKQFFATMPLIAIASLMERKEYNKALQKIEELTAREPNNPTLLHLKINCLNNLGRVQRALALCDEALDIRFKEDASFAAKKAELLMEQGEGEAAKQLVDEWLGKQPEQPRLLAVKARLALQEGKKDEAKLLLRKVLELDPSLELALRSIDEFMEDGLLKVIISELKGEGDQGKQKDCEDPGSTEPKEN